MNMVVKFKHDAFKKGVNDTLTLAPLREIIRDVLKDSYSHGKSLMPHPNKGSGTGGNHERKAASKR